MKKVILIAYYYFQKEIIASNRTTSLLKYLPEFGWDVTLITCGDKSDNQLPNVIAIPNQNPLPKMAGKILSASGLWSSPMSMQVSHTHNEEKGFAYLGILKKILSPIQKLLNKFHLNNILMLGLQQIYHSKLYTSGWHNKPVRAGKKLIKSGEYKAIISTYTPASPHEVASQLQKISHLPWIADYRDLWSANYVIQTSDRAHYKLEKYEAETIKDATYITTVSESLANSQEATFNKPAYFIPNGFDPEEKKIVTPLRRKFTITYTGTFYSHRKSSILFSALSELINTNRISENDLDVRYYGPSVTWLDDEIKNYRLEKCVKQYGVVPKDEAKTMQRSSQLLLLLGPQTEDEDGVFGGKIFEYFGASRPILALGRDSQNVVRTILHETKTGEYFSSTEVLKEALCRWYEEWKLMGSVSYHGDEKEIDKYSYRAMAGKFAELLDSLS